MPVSDSNLASITVKVIGTLVLLAGFVLFFWRAPFLTGDASPADERPPLRGVPADTVVSVGEMQGPTLPEVDDTDGRLDVEPAFGLFNATFSGADGKSGFQTAEHRVPGTCTGAGRRFIETECPDCTPMMDDDGGVGSMLLWQQAVDGANVTRAVSRHCIEMSPDGIPVVGSLTFADGPADLRTGSAKADTSQVPLLVGATRVTTVSLGAWSATYDTVARPSQALPDMAAALKRRGWREVSDDAAFDHKSFEGQRVFVNSANALCMISLSKQGNDYQLLTIINSQA